MGLPFRLQILDLKLIKSVDEQELTLEESDKIVGGLHYSTATHPHYSLIGYLFPAHVGLATLFTNNPPIINPPGGPISQN